MSGYLQRMVASARTPGRSVHPIVGSYFSGAGFGAPIENLQAGEEFLRTPSPGTVEKPSPEVPAPPAARGRIPTEESADETESTTLPEERTPEFRVAPHRGVPQTPAAAADRPVLAGTPSYRPTVPSGIRPPVQDPVPAGNAAAPVPYRPLIEEVQPPASPQMEFMRSAASAAPRGESQVGWPVRGTQPAARQYDEIEIHIGRIEVTAVSQPAARPASQPARKSLNLDEYLKRREGGRR
jgi:hypothetical protein